MKEIWSTLLISIIVPSANKINVEKFNLFLQNVAGTYTLILRDTHEEKAVFPDVKWSDKRIKFT